MAYGESNHSNGHVARKVKGHNRNMLTAQYLENRWRCYLATIANY